MSARIRGWRYAAVIALIGTGVVAAAAMGVKYKYRFVKTDATGRHVVVSEDDRRTWTLAADNPQQAVEVAEEMDLLKQQGKKQLAGVREIEVNGRLDSRQFRYEYTLAGGRKIYQYETDPETGGGTLGPQREREANQLWRDALAAGFRGVRYQQVVQGRTFTFDKHSVTLSDGTKVAWTMGFIDANDDGAALPGNGDAKDAERLEKEDREIALLRQQDKRQLIAVRELVARGLLDIRTFTYRYQLSDGRTIDMNEGAGGEFSLSAAQRKEWVQLRNAGSGQDLGTYEEEIRGRTFAFTRKRFVLSDGTELIQSSGKPKDVQ